MAALPAAPDTVPAHDLLAMRQALDEFGFVVVRDVLDQAQVSTLGQALLRVGRAAGYDGSGDLTLHALVELMPELLHLLDRDTYLRILTFFAGSADLTIGRSAGIIRRPHSQGCGWHTDWNFSTDVPRTVDEVLNVTEQPAGMWFYLTGSAPERGGLAVIAGSHRMDWPGPPGFTFTPQRRSFTPAGGWDGRDAMDVPGMVPVLARGGDLIIFAARTYHAAFPNGPETRLSCALGCRPGRRPLRAPWEQTARARAFLGSAAPRYAPYLEHYLGYDPTVPLRSGSP